MKFGHIYRFNQNRENNHFIFTLIIGRNDHLKFHETKIILDGKYKRAQDFTMRNLKFALVGKTRTIGFEFYNKSDFWTGLKVNEIEIKSQRWIATKKIKT